MRELDGKFSVDNDTIFNTVSGEVIPEDEPLVFFRARDMLALLAALMPYRAACLAHGYKPSHIRGIDDRIAAFRKFWDEHPERMKEPGITEHIRTRES